MLVCLHNNCSKFPNQRQDAIHLITAEIGKGGRPHVLHSGPLLKHQQGETERGGCQLRPSHAHQRVVSQTKFEAVLSQAVLQHVHIPSLGVAPEEIDGNRLRKIEVESLYYLQLSRFNLFLCVRIVSYVNKVRAGWSVSLFYLRSEEHCCNPH